MKLILLCGVLCLVSVNCFAEVKVAPNFERLADCIHRIENGTWPDKDGKGEHYGIHSVKYKDKDEARKICIKTCKHAFRDWDGKGDFLVFLACRYCPVNWRVWYKNTSYYYNKK